MSIILNLIKTMWNKKVIRFGCVGVINTALDFTILNILVNFFDVTPLLANLISASVSISLSYFLNHRLVFRSDNKHTIKSFAHFFLATGAGILIIQTIVIYFLIHLLGTRATGINYLINNSGLAKINNKTINLNLAKLGAVLVAMVWNFLIYHYVIFKKKDVISNLEG